MPLLPDWAPNIHPLLIHFPIVLLIAAVLFDITELIFKKSKWLEKSALTLYIVGTLAIIITYFSGRAAADGLDIPAEVIPAVSAHADWAETALWFFIFFSALRLIIFYWLKKWKTVVNLIAVVGLLGLYFLYQTGDRGAKLVYGYGLGTGNILIASPQSQIDESTTGEQNQEAAFVIDEDGSWEFTAGSNVADILQNKLNVVNGTINQLSPVYNSKDSSLTFNIQDNNREIGFVYNGNLKSIEAVAVVNINNFNGEIKLVHHFVDKNNYDFLGLKHTLNPNGNGNEISLSRKRNSNMKVFEKDKLENEGWIEAKIISHGAHFRGYINNNLIVHGHGSEPQSGQVGIIFSGTGTVMVKMIKTTILN